MQDDEFSNLRNSLRRSTALRATEQSAPRVVEAFPHPNYAYPPARVGMTFWQWCARVIPIVVAIFSTGILAYFLLFQDRSQLLVGSRQEAPPPRDLSGAETSEVGGDQAALVQQAQTKAQAQQQPEPQFEAEAAEQQPIPADLGPRLPMPRDDKLVVLVTSSILALNQANLTGNYTALRDGAAPAFQQNNSPVRLAEIFNLLRTRKLDLSPIVLFTPKLFRAPEMNAEGMIRVTGFFPTEPERVNFDLIYQPVQGQWRLFGIAVETSPATSPAPPSQAKQGGPEPGGADEKPKPEAMATKAATPVKKPKPKAEASDAASPDVRDRIDTPPPAPPAEKPKQKSGWNPFGR